MPPLPGLEKPPLPLAGRRVALNESLILYTKYEISVVTRSDPRKNYPDRRGFVPIGNKANTYPFGVVAYQTTYLLQ